MLYAIFYCTLSMSSCQYINTPAIGVPGIGRVSNLEVCRREAEAETAAIERHLGGKSAYVYVCMSHPLPTWMPSG